MFTLNSTAAHLCLLVCVALVWCPFGHSCVLNIFKKSKPKSFINKEMQVTHSVSVYTGCFLSGGETRDLPVYAGASDENSPNNCNERCRRLRKRFFGLHNARECWCGDTYGNFNPKPDPNIKCYMICPGNQKFKCGSKTHNSVYNTTEY